MYNTKSEAQSQINYWTESETKKTSNSIDSLSNRKIPSPLSSKMVSIEKAYSHILKGSNENSSESESAKQQVKDAR